MNEHRFTGKAEHYDKARPGYPDAAIEYMSSFLPKHPVVADVGSGTGKLTELMLRQGFRVFAVEPNEDMRAISEARLSGFLDYTSVSAKAEETTLPDCSLDAVTAAQALHWFDVDRFRAECKRILKPNGIVFIVYNRFYGEIANSYDYFLRLHCPLFCGLAGGEEANDKIKAFFGGTYSERKFQSVFSYTKDKFIARSLSSSYTPKPSDNDYEEFVTKLHLFFKAHQTQDGTIEFQNETVVYA